MSRHRFDAVLGGGIEGDLPAVVLPAGAAVEDAKRPETRARRVVRAVEAARERAEVGRPSSAAGR